MSTSTPSPSPEPEDSTRPARWTLWRQDDNGTTVAIAQGLSHAEAQTRLAELEARGHKQFYWLEAE